MEEARSGDLEEEEEREICLNLEREAAGLRGLEREMEEMEEMEGEKVKAVLCILGKGRSKEMEIRIGSEREKVKESESKREKKGGRRNRWNVRPVAKKLVRLKSLELGVWCAACPRPATAYSPGCYFAGNSPLGHKFGPSYFLPFFFVNFIYLFI